VGQQSPSNDKLKQAGVAEQLADATSAAKGAADGDMDGISEGMSDGNVSSGSAATGLAVETTSWAAASGGGVGVGALVSVSCSGGVGSPWISVGPGDGRSEGMSVDGLADTGEAVMGKANGAAVKGAASGAAVKGADSMGAPVTATSGTIWVGSPGVAEGDADGAKLSTPETDSTSVAFSSKKSNVPLEVSWASTAKATTERRTITRAVTFIVQLAVCVGVGVCEWMLGWSLNFLASARCSD
jgi:hypothetical protein